MADVEYVDFSLQSLTDVLDQANTRLRGGAHAAARIWPTGFEVLDRNLGGGFRSGELILLAGAQGLGKTTWALQAARNVALSGRSVLFFSFEHDPQTMLIRLVALEAGLVAGVEAPDLARIRSAFEASDGTVRTLRHGEPAQAKLRDEHGQTHYVMVEPGDPFETFVQGTPVLLVQKNGARFAAVRGTTEASVN